MNKFLTMLTLPFAFSAIAAVNVRAEEPKPMLMFVQLADNVEIDAAAETLRLVDVAKQTLYFADRPERIAGHIQMDAYLEEWTSKAGSDNFGADPPNATISIYEPGKADNTLAVVEISDPRIEGSDLVYSFKLIDGTLGRAAARHRSSSTGSGSAAAWASVITASASVPADRGSCRSPARRRPLDPEGRCGALAPCRREREAYTLIRKQPRLRVAQKRTRLLSWSARSTASAFGSPVP